MIAVRRATLTKLGLLAFGVILLSFLARGFGQLLLGPRRAALLAAPFVLLAAVLVITVLGLWTLHRLGAVSIEDTEP